MTEPAEQEPAADEATQLRRAMINLADEWASRHYEPGYVAGAPELNHMISEVVWRMKAVATADPGLLATYSYRRAGWHGIPLVVKTHVVH